MATCSTSNCTTNQICPDKFGCPPNRCPDFEIKRHDTTPPFRVSVNDCDGPLDLTDGIVEVSMWALAKLKKAITPSDEYFALADDIGFFQINIGDIIVMDRIRNPEQMLVTGFDETLNFVQVQRGYNGTTIGDYARGSKMRIFRILNAVAETATVTEDQAQVDGTVQTGVVIDSQLVYNWLPNDTCMPGCFWLEFKLLKMTTPSSLSQIYPLQAAISVIETSTATASVIPSFITAVDGCELGADVEWVRRFPSDSEGFLIKIFDSPTAENVL